MQGPNRRLKGGQRQPLKLWCSARRGEGVFVKLLAVLELLVSVGNLKEIVAQAIAVAAATPCNFLGNKLWTFSE